MTDLDHLCSLTLAPETPGERICRLYVAGKLGMAESIGMLWMKGYSASDAHWMLCAAKEAAE